MKKLLMIAFNFPPEGNAGAYRPLRFVRHLPALGWIPTVLSAIPSQYERYDPALSRMVPQEVETIRIKACDVWQGFQAWRSREVQGESSAVRERPVEHVENRHDRRLRAWLRQMVRTAEAWWYHPDMAMPWIGPAVEASVQLCNRSLMDVIWATAGPVSSFVVAQRSSIRTGIPYVLDFRDPWTITHNTFEARQPRWAKRRARRTMRKLLSGAQAVVFRYETEAECFWRAYPGALDASRIHIIPNGYESPIEEAVLPAGDKCTLLYAGTLPDYRYDTLLRSLVLLKESDPSISKRLRCLFVGEGMESLASDVAALDLLDIVETAGPKSYAEITSLQRQAHGLIVLGRKSKMKGYELFAAAKLFGYLKAGRPIVGVLPEDETKKILHRLDVSTVAEADSVSEIAAVLSKLVHSWSTGTLSCLIPNKKACEAYASERQTARLVRALEGLPAEEAFVPGTCSIPPSLRDTIGLNGWLDN